jgi:hypothetical protein
MFVTVFGPLDMPAFARRNENHNGWDYLGNASSTALLSK